MIYAIFDRLLLTEKQADFNSCFFGLLSKNSTNHEDIRRKTAPDFLMENMINLKTIY